MGRGANQEGTSASIPRFSLHWNAAINCLRKGSVSTALAIPYE